MGLKDTAAKNFFGRPEVLASLLDYIFYDGVPTVKPEQLREVSGEHYRIVQDETGNFKTDNRFRDKLFEFDTGGDKLSVGFELQSRNDRRMVLRIIRYDLRRHNDMLSKDQQSRIVNIVLSFDRKKHMPASLEELFGPPPPFAKKACYNYGFINLNIYDLAEKYEQFSCNELKEVLHYFKVELDNGDLVNALKEGILKGRLSRDAALVCAVFLGLEIQIDNEAEEIDMCKSFRNFKRECIMEGYKKGHEEGRMEGEDSALRTFIKNLLDKSYSFLDICTLTGAPEEKVAEITLALQQS